MPNKSKNKEALERLTETSYDYFEAQLKLCLNFGLSIGMTEPAIKASIAHVLRTIKKQKAVSSSANNTNANN